MAMLRFGRCPDDDFFKFLFQREDHFGIGDRHFEIPMAFIIIIIMFFFYIYQSIIYYVSKLLFEIDEGMHFEPFRKSRQSNLWRRITFWIWMLFWFGVSQSKKTIEKIEERNRAKKIHILHAMDIWAHRSSNETMRDRCSMNQIVSINQSNQTNINWSEQIKNLPTKKQQQKQHENKITWSIDGRKYQTVPWVSRYQTFASCRWQDHPMPGMD